MLDFKNLKDEIYTLQRLDANREYSTVGNVYVLVEVNELVVSLEDDTIGKAYKGFDLRNQDIRANDRLIGSKGTFDVVAVNEYDGVKIPHKELVLKKVDNA